MKHRKGNERLCGVLVSQLVVHDTHNAMVMNSIPSECISTGCPISRHNTHIVQHIIASSQVELHWQFYDVGTLAVLK